MYAVNQIYLKIFNEARKIFYVFSIPDPIYCHYQQDTQVCRQKGEMGYEKKNFISDNGGSALSFTGSMRGGS